MSNTTNKTLLALSISILLSTPLITACGGSDGGSNNNPNVTDPAKPTPPEQRFEVKAFADNATFTPTKVAHWDPSPVLPSKPDKSDEYVRKMQVQHGNLVAINVWHNSIVKLDTDKSVDSTVDPEFFATLMTSEHGVKSSDDDIISGASEHYLTDVQYTEDGKTLYALVSHPRREGPDDDDTYGLFKVGLNADGSIPTTMVKGQPVAHRGDHVQRVADAKIDAILPIADGALLALDDTNHAIRYYDDQFALQESKSFGLAENDDLESWSADDEAVYLLIESETDDVRSYRLEKRLLSSPAVAAQTLGLGEDVYGVIAHDGHVLIVNDHSLQLLGSELTPLSEVTFAHEIERFSAATDFSRVAVIDGNGQLQLVDIADGKLSVPMKVDLNGADDISRLALADANTMFYNDDRGEIVKLDLNQPVVMLTDQQVIERSLDQVEGAAINHGYPLAATRYDLQLPTQDVNLPITYTWSSSNPSVVSNEGKVTMPTSRAEPVTMTLTASSEDGKVTASKDFELTVLPQVQMITTGTQSDLEALLDTRYLNYTHRQFNNHTANMDGSVFALFKDEGYTLLQRQADNTLKAVLQAPATLLMPAAQELTLTDPEIMTVAWQGTDTLWMVLSDEAGGALIKKSFSDVSDLEALTTEAKSSWTVVKTYDYPIYKALVNSSGTHISLVKDKGNEAPMANGYQITTYDVATGTVLSDYSTDLDLNRKSATIDDTGKYIFVRDEDEETDQDYYYRYVQGVSDSKLAIDQTYYSGVITAQGDLVAGGRNGQLLFIKQATASAPLNADNSQVISFGREDFNGETSLRQENGRNTGRLYTMSLKGDKLFAGYSHVGTSIIDLSDFNNPLEIQHIPYNNELFLSLLSGDGDTLLQVSREGKFNLTAVP